MVKAENNPFKSKINMVDACFYDRETHPITFEGLDLEGRLTTLKFSKDKHVMLKVALAHNGKKNVLPLVRLKGFSSI